MTRTIAGLPLWAWGLGLAAFAGTFWWIKKKSSGGTTTSSQPAFSQQQEVQDFQIFSQLTSSQQANDLSLVGQMLSLFEGGSSNARGSGSVTGSGTGAGSRGGGGSSGTGGGGPSTTTTTPTQTVTGTAVATAKASANQALANIGSKSTVTATGLHKTTSSGAQNVYVSKGGTKEITPYTLATGKATTPYTAGGAVKKRTGHTTIFVTPVTGRKVTTTYNWVGAHG